MNVINPTTAQLQAAREFLERTLAEWDRNGFLDAGQMKIAPHFRVIIEALTPVAVQDAHRARAEDIVGEDPREPTADERIATLEQAIAEAEVRGAIKDRDGRAALRERLRRSADALADARMHVAGSDALAPAGAQDDPEGTVIVHMTGTIREALVALLREAGGA